MLYKQAVLGHSLFIDIFPVSQNDPLFGNYYSDTISDLSNSFLNIKKYPAGTGL